MPRARVHDPAAAHARSGTATMSTPGVMDMLAGWMRSPQGHVNAKRREELLYYFQAASAKCVPRARRCSSAPPSPGAAALLATQR